MQFLLFDLQVNGRRQAVDRAFAFIHGATKTLLQKAGKIPKVATAGDELGGLR